MRNMDIKKWYSKKYPTDSLGLKLKNNITFNDLFICLDSYKDVYGLLGVDDSIVRERVFSQLAKVMNVSYEYIYDQWMMAI